MYYPKLYSGLEDDEELVIPVDPPLRLPSRRSEKYLNRLTGKVKRKAMLVFDIESKDGESQKAGFTRPFMCGAYDGTEFQEFWNDMSVARGPHRHILPNGNIDKFMHWLFRPDGCRECFYKFTVEHHGRPGRVCPSCKAHREKYSSKKCNIFSHNGGRFDELFLLGWLIKNKARFKFEISAVQSRIQRLDVWPTGLSQAKLSWTFLDSFSILPLGLRQIGKDLLGSDLEKLPAVKDAEKLAREKGKIDLNLSEHDRQAWSTYNKADLTVLYLALHRYHDLIEKLGGEVGITAPATSMKLFRRRYQKKAIPRNRHFKKCDGKCDKAGIDKEGNPIPCATHCDLKCHGCAHHWVRGGYYGGRTEKYGEYWWDYKYHDINSSYPASMMDEMPVGDMTEFGPEKSWRVLHEMRKTHIGFIECEVEIPENCYIPPLPYRYERKLVFPTGRFSGIWDYDELKLLEDPLVNGKVVRVFRSVWYKKAPIFREMVTTLYKYRQKHIKPCGPDSEGMGTACHKPSCNPIFNKGMALIAKLMLNALYGKFGMREDRTGIVMIGDDGVKPVDGFPINGKHSSPFWEVERYVDAAYIIPQISAHITTLSRIRLWRGMAFIIRSGGRLFYVDTDSVKSSIDMPSSDDLGEWKKEEPDVLLEGEWITNKLYKQSGHLKDGSCKGAGKCTGCAILDGGRAHRHDCKDDRCKGCAVSVEKMKGVGYDKQTPEHYQSMVHEKGTIRGKRLTQHRTMLNKGLISPVMAEWSKSIKSEYDKRAMLKNGDSLPLYLVEERMDGL